jgi:transcriptional regulator with XRE-family HTH domain
VATKKTKSKPRAKRAAAKSEKPAHPGLAERLAKIRGDRSQRQFATDLGVCQQNVNRYEAGQTPHVDFLVTLAEHEKVSIDWLLLGKGAMKR